MYQIRDNNEALQNTAHGKIDLKRCSEEADLEMVNESHRLTPRSGIRPQETTIELRKTMVFFF